MARSDRLHFASRVFLSIRYGAREGTKEMTTAVFALKVLIILVYAATKIALLKHHCPDHSIVRNKLASL